MAKRIQSKPLPESNLNTDKAQTLVKDICENHKQIAVLNNDLKESKTDFSKICEEYREKEAEKNEFTGIIRVTSNEGDTVRCEFRMNGNSALDISQGNDLNKLFGSSRSILFQKTEVVTTITEPEKLIKELGPDAFDYLELRVKDGADGVVIAKSPDTVITEEAFLPKKEFLSNLKEIMGTLKDDAKSFLKIYLKQALKPFVVVGGKGTSK